MVYWIQNHPITFALLLCIVGGAVSIFSTDIRYVFTLSFLKSISNAFWVEILLGRMTREQAKLLRSAHGRPRLTNILFPWAANVAGYDTGFAIANTTSDIFGTTSQSGACVYNFFGSNPPPGGTFVTRLVAGGAVDTQILSNIAPCFAGYIIIQCNFEHAYGLSMITNGFGGGAVTVGTAIVGTILTPRETARRMAQKK